jgi:hypothetical protein
LLTPLGKSGQSRISLAQTFDANTWELKILQQDFVQEFIWRKPDIRGN